MTRRTVKLLLVDPDQRLLLVCGHDTDTGLCHWYPVGGGIESDESLDQAAAREAWEETGPEELADGVPVWTRDAIYTHSGRTYNVHETWLHYQVHHYEPAPAMLTEYEKDSIMVDLRRVTDYTGIGLPSVSRGAACEAPDRRLPDDADRHREAPTDSVTRGTQASQVAIV